MRTPDGRERFATRRTPRAPARPGTQAPGRRTGGAQVAGAGAGAGAPGSPKCINLDFGDKKMAMCEAHRGRGGPNPRNQKSLTYGTQENPR